MKNVILILLLIVFAQNSHAATASLKYSTGFLLEKVLEKKRLVKRADIPEPKIYFSSKTPLKQFQDAIEKQWGFRPVSITNAFAVNNNEIYIMDDADYYSKLGRCMDDSLVHEYVHYLQVKYLNWDLNDDSLEWDAIDIQTEFRSAYCPI